MKQTPQRRLITALTLGFITLTPSFGLAITIPSYSPIELAQALSRESSSLRGSSNGNNSIRAEGRYLNLHPFEGRAGEQVTIQVSGELELFLVLLDSNDNPIARDNSSGKDKAQITITLPATDTYTIGVLSFEAGGTGNYTLSWREATADDLKLAEAQRLNEQVLQLLQQGEYATAIPLAQQALEILEKVFGEEHPNVAQSLNNLGLLYNNQGEYAKAEPLYLRSLEILEKVFGEEHPNVAQSLNNLGLLYNNQGEYAKVSSLSTFTGNCAKVSLNYDTKKVSPPSSQFSPHQYPPAERTSFGRPHQKSVG